MAKDGSIKYYYYYGEKQQEQEHVFDRFCHPIGLGRHSPGKIR
jgi:hypothetical protein